MIALLPPPPRLVIVSWDGAGDLVVKRLLAEGRLPNLARLIRDGAVADGVIPAWPSKTAVGHFAVFSGTWPDRSGVVGNSVPVSADGPITETTTGFGGGVHRTEPLWVTAARAGRRVSVLSAAGSFPPEPDLARLKGKGRPFTQYSGFEAEIARPQVLLRFPADFRVGETAFRATVDGDGVRIGDVRVGRKGWSAPVEVRKGDLVGTTAFRLFDLRPDGTGTLYVRGASGLRGSSPRLAEYRKAMGPWHDFPFDPYRRGELGPPLTKGGDGTAEDRVVELIEEESGRMAKLTDWAFRTERPDVLFEYTPLTDGAGHCWMGVLDASLPGHDPVLAARLWPRYAAVFAAQDRWLGEIRRQAGPNAVLAVVSDHGMAGHRTRVGPAAILRDAGLLTFKPDGTIDLARTKALPAPWNEWAIAVNGTERRGGIVPPAERTAVIAAARRALLRATDPDGEPLVRAAFLPEDIAGVGAAGGDLFVEWRPGLLPDGRIDRVLVPIAEPLNAGSHGYWPMRPDMRAIFAVAGPGVPKGRKWPLLRQIDVFPTLAKLVRLPVPPEVQGQSAL